MTILFFFIARRILLNELILQSAKFAGGFEIFYGTVIIKLAGGYFVPLGHPPNRGTKWEVE
jgi:hypothetical protein